MASTPILASSHLDDTSGSIELFDAEGDGRRALAFWEREEVGAAEGLCTSRHDRAEAPRGVRLEGASDAPEGSLFPHLGQEALGMLVGLT